MAGLGDLTSSLSGGFSQAGSIAMYIFYGLVFGIVVWMAWYFTSFNVEVRILERNRGGYLMEKGEKGKFKKDKYNPGVFLFTMMRDKRWEMPFPKDYVQLKKGSLGRMKRVVYLLEDEEGRLQPIKPPTGEAALTWVGWKPNAMEFVTRKVREYAERFRKGDFFAKYGNLIQIGGIIIMFVLILVLFKQLEKVNTGLTQVAGAFETAAKNMAAANTGGQVIT